MKRLLIAPVLDLNVACQGASAPGFTEGSTGGLLSGTESGGGSGAAGACVSDSWWTDGDRGSAKMLPHRRRPGRRPRASGAAVRLMFTALTAWLSLFGLLVSCASTAFDPPAEPPHTDFEEGYAHASGKDTPFLCRDPESGDRVTCPDTRPEPRDVSCDAAGCHGDLDYGAAIDPDARHLFGSDGPSCWTCHDREWSTTKER